MIALITLGCAPAAKPADAFISIRTTGASPISPYIYGANSPDWSKMSVPFTMARQGGNRMTAYNWETNASNAGSDYHFQNDGYMGESNEPGLTVKTFLQGAQEHGAAVIITVPTAGYVSADKKGDGDVRQTPDYLNTRFVKSYAHKPGAFDDPPDTTDHAVYQDEFVHWIEKIKSPQTPVWFMLDNEPDLWGSTHAEIWSHNPTYAEIIQNNIEYATAIKAAAPRSLVFGPANYGWNGFHTFQNAPDANGRDFLNTYLEAMKDAESKAGHRILDVLDVHWYPEAKGGGKRVTDQGNAATDAARIQASRSLWDPSYVEDSWIEQATQNKPIQLLPTILGQIAAHYPGTKFSISEYNYGGNTDISGAIAEADVLGIFGRYGLFAASNWGVSPADTAEIAGFNVFLNFDGKGGRFGDQELKLTGETAASDSVYASQDSKHPNRYVIVAINKTAASRAFEFNLHGVSLKSVAAYSITSDSLSKPHETDIQPDGSKIEFAAPPLSVTTIEVNG
jgi:Glycoside hydrolase family 44